MDERAHGFRELLRTLVSIESTNPDLVQGGTGEGAIADAVSEWLGARGFEIHRLESRPGRPSVVAIARGTGGGQSLMLNGHLDTVTLAGYDGGPLDPRIEGDKLFGRGAYDMKSGVAAMMVAASSAAARPHGGDIMLALVADEEYASEGTAEVLRSFRSDAAIVVEPSDLQVTMAHKGFVWADVVIEGKAWHGSRPDLGIDAIAKAGHFLVALDEIASDLAASLAHPLLGTPSVHASMIRGGEERSSYPAECRIAVEYRTLPGQNAGTVERDIRRILDGIVGGVPDFAYRLDMGLERSSFEANAEAPVIRSLFRHVQDVTGAPVVTRGEPFWTDCALYADAGIPVVLFGAAGDGAHAATEWVSLSSCETVVEVLTRIILETCA
jgi:acetylornithine deacetylase